MNLIPFDTLAYYNRLKDAGMDANLAEVISEMNAEIIRNIMEEQTITKQDVKDIKIEIEELRYDTKHEFHELEKRLYGFIGKSVGWTVSILTAIQTFYHFLK